MNLSTEDILTLQNLVEECSLKYKRSYMTYVSSKLKGNKELFSKLVKERERLRLKSFHLSEVLYRILIDKEEKFCSICGKEVIFLNFKLGYKECCSRSCSHKTESYKERVSKLMKGRVSKLKGRSYLEIYGTETPKCGYQRGELNVAKREDIRKKISLNVTKSYTPELRSLRSKKACESNFNRGHFKRRNPNEKGERFLSSLEVRFSELLKENNIDYEYEKVVLLNNGKRKIVDFVIDNEIFIEISGYATFDWKRNFCERVEWLRESLDPENFIILLTYSKNVEELFSDSLFIGANVFIGDVEDERKVLKTINFARNLIKFNKKIK